MKTVDEPRSLEAYGERLLEGLAQSICKKGLQQTQITDIVRNARASRRTFYECFEDKASCFLELIPVEPGRARRDAGCDRSVGALGAPGLAGDR